jgi:2-keto-4-pentenoate hydratase/2-oxohepta-3-ene-1,7-dioic acid hydratase in catechol pathway
MRLARWISDGAVAEGFVVGDRVVPFPGRLTVADLLAGGLEAAAAVFAEIEAEPGSGAEAGSGTEACSGTEAGSGGVAARPLAEVTLLAPLVPPAIRDFVAFEEHVEGVSASVDGRSEVVAEWYEAPTFYFTNPHTVRATGDTVHPPETRLLDFELELAAVIGGVPGRTGENLSPVDAGAHIFGYTIMNDWSARDLQSREMKVRLGPAKGKDFATTLGPWIVTADELEPFTDGLGFLRVRAEAYVNDELVGADLVSNMGWPFAELVSYASRNSNVVPGDVLGSGTVGNGGCLAELWGRSGETSPHPLVAGDRVRLVVEGVGEIVNTVGAPVVLAPPAPARHRNRARQR